MSSSNTVLDIKDFLAVNLVLKKTSLKYILLGNQFYYNMDAIKHLLLFSLVINNLTYYGRRHLKLFVNCYVSWDTLYVYFMGS